MTDQPIKSVATPWHDVLLVCGKCSKKLKKRGYGDKGKTSLPSALKNALRSLGQRRSLRIAETGCFGVCPKKAVCLVRTGRPGEVLTVPAKTPLPVILERLGLQPIPPPAREE